MWLWGVERWNTLVIKWTSVDYFFELVWLYNIQCIRGVEGEGGLLWWSAGYHPGYFLDLNICSQLVGGWGVDGVFLGWLLW